MAGVPCFYTRLNWQKLTDIDLLSMPINPVYSNPSHRVRLPQIVVGGCEVTMAPTGTVGKELQAFTLNFRIRGRHTTHKTPRIAMWVCFLQHRDCDSYNPGGEMVYLIGELGMLSLVVAAATSYSARCLGTKLNQFRHL
jgi:hypothetical protein